MEISETTGAILDTAAFLIFLSGNRASLSYVAFAHSVVGQDLFCFFLIMYKKKELVYEGLSGLHIIYDLCLCNYIKFSCRE